MCNLKPLFERREQKCLDFSLKCIKHTKNSRIFPINPNQLESQQGFQTKDIDLKDIDFLRLTSQELKSTESQLFHFVKSF